MEAEQQQQIDPAYLNQVIDNLHNYQRANMENFVRFSEVMSGELARMRQLSESMAANSIALITAIKAQTQVFIQGFQEIGAPNPPKVVGIDVAQRITGKAKSTIYNLASAGKIPSIKSGGRLKFLEGDLIAFSFQPRAIDNQPDHQPQSTPLPSGDAQRN